MRRFRFVSYGVISSLWSWQRHMKHHRSQQQASFLWVPWKLASWTTWTRNEMKSVWRNWIVFRSVLVENVGWRNSIYDRFGPANVESDFWINWHQMCHVCFSRFCNWEILSHTMSCKSIVRKITSVQDRWDPRTSTQIAWIDCYLTWRGDFRKLRARFPINEWTDNKFTVNRWSKLMLRSSSGSSCRNSNQRSNSFSSDNVVLVKKSVSSRLSADWNRERVVWYQTPIQRAIYSECKIRRTHCSECDHTCR